ncbi:MAG: transporter, partial [Candidatus Omnitrophota bacterium]
MKKSLFLAIMCGSLLWMPVSAWSARPLLTDDAGTVGKGTFEYAFGFEMLKDGRKEYDFVNCLKYGPVDNVDIGVEVPFVFMDNKEENDEEGFSDIAFCAKYNFLRENKIADLSLRFDFKADNGNDRRGLGSGQKDYAVFLIATREISDMAFHFNVGYSFIGDSDDFYSFYAAFEKALTEKCNFVCEAATETDFSGDFDDHLFEGLIGANYALRENVFFDFGVGFPFSEASADYKLTT